MKKISIFLLSCFVSLNAETINVKLSKNNKVVLEREIVDVENFSSITENGYVIDFSELERSNETVMFSAKICNGDYVIAQPILKNCYNHETTFSIAEENGDTLVLDINISK